MSAHQPVDKGSLLIAEPFLNDPNFERGVVLLCEHNAKGSFGFVVNQKTGLMLGDVLEDTIYPQTPLYLGGPVEKDTLHFIHRRPDLIPESVRIGHHLYWGGNFEQIKSFLNQQQLSTDDIRFFAGYSGWAGGQLEEELEAGAWIVSNTDSDFLFGTPPDHFWREILKRMGGKYKSIAHYPTDPRLN